jgi:hypothetical protein
VRGLLDLHEAYPKWATWYVAELPVVAVKALKVEVRYSPQDCEFEAVRDAHASLIGVTRLIRLELIRLIEQHLQPLAATGGP